MSGRKKEEGPHFFSKMKRSTLQEIKKKYGMENDPDQEVLEWYRRTHGTGYAIELVDG